MEMDLEKFREFFMSRMNSGMHGHFGSLGLVCTFIEDGRAGLDLPYDERFVTNPASGILAGGVITALVDTCCAIASATRAENFGFSPTLDLRIDHMGVAEAGKTVHAEAEVYRTTRNVIFTRGKVFQEDRARPIAHCLVNFTPVAHKVMDSQAGMEAQS
ncbi:hypothetical protein NBRC116493_24910 [Aurantivibrio infirmus]